MTTFKQSASVRVEDYKERKALIEWLEGIGYKSTLSAQHNSWGNLIVVQRYGTIQNTGLEWNPNLENKIDCGTNIPMLKALAAIRDDSDYMQWVIKQDGSGRIYRCSDAKINNDKYHKATPAEIVEHFKNQE